MKIQEYIVRHPYFGRVHLKDATSLSPIHHWDILNDLVSIVEFRNRVEEAVLLGHWVEKPQKTLELLLAFFPGKKLIEDGSSSPHDTTRIAVLEAIEQIDGRIKDLLRAGANPFLFSSHKKVEILFGGPTPLFLMGALGGRFDLIDTFEGVSQVHLREFTGCAALFGEIEILNKAWAYMNENTREDTLLDVWMPLSLDRVISKFPTPDPPLIWWSSAISQYQSLSLGRTNVARLIEERPHLATHMVKSQLLKSAPEIQLVLGAGPTPPDGFLGIIMMGWASKLKGRYPTQGNLADLAHRVHSNLLIHNLCGFDQDWLTLGDLILSLNNHHEATPTYQSSPQDPSHTAKESVVALFTRIWIALYKENPTIDCWREAIDLILLGGFAHTQIEEYEYSSERDLAYLLKLNEILNVVFTESLVRNEGDPTDPLFRKAAHRILEKKIPPGLNSPLSSDASALSARMEHSLWSLVVSRSSSKSQSESVINRTPLNNKERGYIKVIEAGHRRGASFVFSAKIFQGIEKSFGEDEYIPAHLVATLQYGALSGKETKTQGSGRRRL